MAEEQNKQMEEKIDTEKQEVKLLRNGKERIAMVNAMSIKVSTKHSIDICNMIRGKSIERALNMLENVTKYKRVVKMNTREVGHKHGKGIMAGRYPIKASGEFIKLLKNLRANAIALEIEPENKVIFCKSNLASRPYRSGGTKGKRTNITLKLEDKKMKKQKKKMKKNKAKIGVKK